MITTKKPRIYSQDYKDKRAIHPNITKQEKEAIKQLKEDDTWVVLMADKGVAMVVMDKSSYVDKCMALLQDTNVYQPCRDLTGQIHRQVQASLHRLKGKHCKDHQWVQLHYNQLLPMGRSSPPARFYGLPKIHKAYCPMCPMWDFYIQFSQISNQNLKGVHCSPIFHGCMWKINNSSTAAWKQPPHQRCATLMSDPCMSLCCCQLIFHIQPQ